MYKVLAAVTALTLLGACGGGSDAKMISFKPQIWNGDENRVEVTRQGMGVTSTDTERLAQQHCAKYNKTAKLVDLASPIQLPPRDEYACE
jgi:hypothetical protein